MNKNENIKAINIDLIKDVLMNRFDSNSIEEISDEIFDITADIIENRFYNIDSKKIERFLNSNEKFINYLDFDQNVHVKRAYFYGVIKSTFEMMLEQKKRYNSYIEITELRNRYKYIKPIIVMLYERQQCYHKEIAGELDVSITSLSNFFDRVKDYNLFHTEKIGKYKYYYLTNKGNRIYHYVIESENGKSFDELLFHFLAIIDVEQKVESKINLADRIVSKFAIDNPKYSKLNYKQIKMKLNDILDRSNSAEDFFFPINNNYIKVKNIEENFTWTNKPVAIGFEIKQERAELYSKFSGNEQNICYLNYEPSDLVEVVNRS